MLMLLYRQQILRFFNIFLFQNLMQNASSGKKKRKEKAEIFFQAIFYTFSLKHLINARHFIITKKVKTSNP